MAKELLFDESAREKLIAGMCAMAEAVGSTLGPKGQCVIIDEYSNGMPHITKDGVTVAKNITLEDKYQNVGATLLRQAALNTVNAVGDATTTSTVLAYKMVENAYETYKNCIINISDLKKGIELAKESVEATILTSSKEIKKDDVARIASISANGDSEIGNLVAEMYDKVGLDGVITVEESANNQTTTDVTNGMQFERGFASHWFITDREKSECVLENAYVLVTDQKIQLTREIIPAAEYSVKNGHALLVIAQDFDDEVIQNIRLNVLQGRIKCCLVKAPSFGDYRKGLLEDIAIITGAQIATYDNGIEVSKMDGTMLGLCEKVVVTKDFTTLLHGDGNSDEVAKRVAELKHNLSTLQSGEETLQKYYRGRIARLVGGIGVIRVGGNSELEMREKKDRIEDAVCATKAALEEGIVPGGGLTFLKAWYNLPLDLNPAVQQGINIVKNALTSVTEKIVNNAGFDFKSVESGIKPFENISWDANTETYVNFLDAGIINPTKADRLAFENALSVLNMFISTNCIIIEKDIFKQYV